VRQFSKHGPTGHRPAEIFVRGLDCRLLIPTAAQGDLGIDRPLTSCLAPRLDDLLLGLGNHQPVGLLGREACRFGTAGRYDDGGLARRTIEQLGMVKLEVPTAV